MELFCPFVFVTLTKKSWLFFPNRFMLGFRWSDLLRVSWIRFSNALYWLTASLYYHNKIFHYGMEWMKSCRTEIKDFWKLLKQFSLFFTNMAETKNNYTTNTTASKPLIIFSMNLQLITLDDTIKTIITSNIPVGNWMIIIL